MNMIFSVENQYTEKIFNNKKPFEFRNNLPKEIRIGDTIYIYETYKNGGQKKIVGEVIVEDLIDLRPNGETPMFGAWNFIDYYMEHVEKDKEKAKLFKIAKEINLPDYKFGCLITYAFSPFYMNMIKEGKYPNYNSFCKEDNKLVQEGDECLRRCDDWLRNIGYYSWDDSSYWQYAIKIRPIKKYDIPIDIKKFKDKNGNFIKKAPQSWMYTNN